MRYVAHVYVSARVCARTCARVISETSTLFQSLCYLTKYTYLIYVSDFCFFRHVGLFLCFYVSK